MDYLRVPLKVSNFLLLATLKDYFNKFGEIKSVIIMRDANTNVSRGFGFCIFSEASAAKKAIENGPHIIDNKEVLFYLLLG